MICFSFWVSLQAHVFGSPVAEQRLARGVLTGNGSHMYSVVVLEDKEKKHYFDILYTALLETPQRKKSLCLMGCAWMQATGGRLQARRGWSECASCETRFHAIMCVFIFTARAI